MSNNLLPDKPLTPEEAREMYANMSEEQRAELAKMMDEQLDEYMEHLEKTGQK